MLIWPSSMDDGILCLILLSSLGQFGIGAKLQNISVPKKHQNNDQGIWTVQEREKNQHLHCTDAWYKTIATSDRRR